MKLRLVVTVLAIVMLISGSNAVDWQGRLGFGIRGPLISPLYEGGSYNKFSGNEPFMMGYAWEFDVKYGISRSLVMGITASMANTYDHPFNSKDQSFNEIFNKVETSPTKLKGMLLSLEGNYYFFPEQYIQPYILAGAGLDMWEMTTKDSSVNFSSYPVGTKYKFSDISGKLGFGVNFWVSNQVTFDIQGKLSLGITNMSADDDTIYYGDMGEWDSRAFTAYFEPSLGLTYYFGGKVDTDGDGVDDGKDRCPDTPKGALVNERGCPLDSDNDGVFDGLDKCPNTPTQAVVDIAGCPLDSDGDGIYDGLDRCPNTPSTAQVDNSGCPIDTDRDGVPDYRDLEINTPFKVEVDENGVGLDTDNDGVFNGLDRCPTTAAGVTVDEFGCPIEVAKPVEKITLNIKYASGSYEPDAAAKKVLDDLAETMQAYVDYTIEIDGFTDNVGSEEANQKLSQKRADAVMKYLLDKGVEPFRMTSKGFGEDPRYAIGDNNTPEGKRQNRRVEIISIQ